MQSTMTSKGQITVPAKVRRDLGLVPGARVDFVRVDEDTYAMHVVRQPLSTLAGMLHQPGRRLTVEEMNEAIAEGAVGRQDAT